MHPSILLYKQNWIEQDSFIYVFQLISNLNGLDLKFIFLLS